MIQGKKTHGLLEAPDGPSWSGDSLGYSSLPFFAVLVLVSEEALESYCKL